MMGAQASEVVVSAGGTGMGRAVIAAPMLYRASPQASFVTGEVLNATGAWFFGR